MKLSLACLLSLIMIAHAPAKDTSNPAPALPASKAQVFTMKNGLTIIVEEDRSAPVASVQAWCDTGSIDEGKWMGAGLSHILEHMLFKGTEKRKGGDIARQVQDQGGYINAYTSFDRTVYWIDVPASGVKEAVDIVADAMMNSTLPKEEYAKEQEVIRREFAMGFDDPDRQSSLLMLRTVFTESPFKNPVIGHLDIYNKLTRDDVMEYYKKRYVPNNLTFVVVGDVNAQEIRAQIEEAFKDQPRRAIEPAYIPTEPEQIGRREAHEEFATELTRLSLAWRIPGLTHPDTPALDLLGSVLGSGRSSILNQTLREKLKIVHAIDAGMFSLQTDGIFVIDAVCDPDKRDEVEKQALAVVDQVKKKGVSQADLDKVRRAMLSSQISGLATVRGKASDLGSNWHLTKNTNFSKEYLDAINKVTTGDLQRVAREYLREDRLNVTSLNPIGSLAQKEKDETKVEKSDVQKFTLSNGLRLLVREDPRLPLVSIIASFRGGLLAETPANNGITRLLSRTMIKGTKTRTAAQIAQQIEGAGGRIAADSGNNSFTASVEVMKPDLSLGLDILSDVLKNPTFPEAEVALEKQAQLAAIKEEDERPVRVAGNLMRQKLFGSHPYSLRNSGSVEGTNAITQKDLQAFHDQYVTGSNGVIAVFGDVKAEDVLKLVEKHFGSLPAGKLMLTDAPTPPALEQPAVFTENRNKQQAVIMIGYPGANIDSQDRTTLELIDEASNDLSSRFFDRIREQLGLAYYVGAQSFFGLSPGFFLFYLGTDPAKVDPVMTAFQDEISKLATDGLTAEELVRAKKKLLGSEAIRDQSNGAFAASVAANELLGLGYDNYLKRRQEIEAVTQEDTKRIARKYLSVPGRVEVTVRPPEKPAAQDSTPQ